MNALYTTDNCMGRLLEQLRQEKLEDPTRHPALVPLEPDETGLVRLTSLRGIFPNPIAVYVPPSGRRIESETSRFYRTHIPLDQARAPVAGLLKIEKSEFAGTEIEQEIAFLALVHETAYKVNRMIEGMMTASYVLPVPVVSFTTDEPTTRWGMVMRTLRMTDDIEGFKPLSKAVSWNSDLVLVVMKELLELMVFLHEDMPNFLKLTDQEVVGYARLTLDPSQILINPVQESILALNLRPFTFEDAIPELHFALDDVRELTALGLELLTKTSDIGSQELRGTLTRVNTGQFTAKQALALIGGLYHE